MSSITSTPSISSTPPPLSLSEPSPAQDFRTVASSMQNALVERDRTIEKLLKEIATLKLEASENQPREVNYQEMEVPDIEGVVSHIEAQDAALSALIQEHEVARQRLLQQSSMTENLSQVNATLDQENASLKQALEAKDQLMLSQRVEIQQKERAELEREQKREASTQEIEELLKEIEVDERAREAKIQKIVENGQKRAEEIKALMQKTKANKQESEANKKKRETLMQELKALPHGFNDSQQSEALIRKFDTWDQEFETLLQELEATKQAHEVNEQKSEADRQEIELLIKKNEATIQRLKYNKQKKEVTLNFLKSFSNSAALSETEIQLLIYILKNESGHYASEVRLMAVSILFQQSSLSEQIRPFLEAVLQDKEERVKAAVAVVLGRYFPVSDAILQILLEVIANKNGIYRAAYRVNAVAALKRQSTLSEQVRPFLEAALQDTDEQVKAAVAVALTHHFPASDTTIQILLEVIANKSGYYEAEFRINAATALLEQSTLPEQVRPFLEAVLQDKDEQAKAAVAVVLGWHFPASDSTLQILLEVIANKNGIYEMADRVHAATALKRQPILSEQVRPFLEAVLQDTDEHVKAAVAVALSWHFPASDTALQILLEIIANKNGIYEMADRINAVAALKRQPALSEQVRSFLEVVLQDTDEQVKAAVAVALTWHFPASDTALQILLEVIANKNGTYGVAYRVSAANALHQQSSLSGQVRPFLEAVLQDTDEQVKAAVAVALTWHFPASDTTLQILLEVIANKNRQYAVEGRVNAATALKRQPILSEQVRPFLEAVLQDTDEHVKAAVAVALTWHFPASDTTLQILLEVIANKNRQYAVGGRVNAATALKRQPILSEQVRPFLEAVLQDKEERVRAAVAIALGWHFSVPDTTLQILLEVIANKNGIYRAVHRVNAATALKRQPTLSEQVCPFLEAVLQDKEKRVRAAVAVALGWHFPASDSTLQILLEVIANKNRQYGVEERANAAFALGEQSILSEQARLVLEAALQDKEEKVKAKTAIALGRHGKLPNTGMPILLDILADKDDRYEVKDRDSAAFILGEQLKLLESVRSALEAAL